MHSRIIQLTKERPDLDEILKEDDFDGFESPIQNYIPGADYVQEVRDRADDIRWFINFLSDDLELKDYVSLHPTEEIICFKKGFKDAFLKLFYKRFMELAQSITFENFSCNSLELYRLRELIDPQYGFKICSYEYADMYSLQDFVRSMDDEGSKYYIGGILDYHY